jgi:hypothetical protein
VNVIKAVVDGLKNLKGSHEERQTSAREEKAASAAA